MYNEIKMDSYEAWSKKVRAYARKHCASIWESRYTRTVMVSREDYDASGKKWKWRKTKRRELRLPAK